MKYTVIYTDKEPIPQRMLPGIYKALLKPEDTNTDIIDANLVNYGDEVIWQGKNAIYSFKNTSIVPYKLNDFEEPWKSNYDYWADESKYVDTSTLGKGSGLYEEVLGEFHPVTKPTHYNKSGIECLDAIEASMTRREFEGYLKGNIEKYLWRFRYKGNPNEDLEKANWYLNKLIKTYNSPQPKETQE